MYSVSQTNFSLPIAPKPGDNNPGKREISRRRFLKVGAKSACVVAAYPLLKPFGLPQWQVLAIQFLLSLAAGVGAGVISQSINDWVRGLSSNEKTQVATVNDSINSDGFNDLTICPVHQAHHVFTNGGRFYGCLYGVGTTDRMNGCAVLFGHRGAVVYGGPVIFGLLMAVDCLLKQDVKSDVLARVLLPIAPAHNQYSVGRFGNSFNQNYRYGSSMGTISVDYQAAQPSLTNSGNIVDRYQVIASQTNGDALYNATFERAPFSV